MSGIDDYTGKAALALKNDQLFEAERHGVRALDLAHREGDFVRMLAVLPTIEQARLRRLARASETGTVMLLDEPFTEQMQVPPGCYIVQPPLVGADARRLRVMVRDQNVMACVMCREPVTRMGLVPFVAIGNGATVRVQIRPPEDIEHPGLDWFGEALEAIGEAAQEIDPEMGVEKRIDLLLARLEAIPEHEGLHRGLEQTCREAIETLSGNSKSRR